MTQMYLYHSVAAPQDEIEEAWEQNQAMLSEGGWKKVGAGRFELGDLRVHMIRVEEHPEDLRAGRRLPADYEVIDTVFTSVNCFPPPEDGPPPAVGGPDPRSAGQGHPRTAGLRRQPGAATEDFGLSSGGDGS